MIVIIPDPSTRRCHRHRENLMTDSIPCMRCEGTRIANEVLSGAKQMLADYMAAEPKEQEEE